MLSCGDAYPAVGAEKQSAIPPASRTGWYLSLKAVIDWTAALILLVLASPLLILAALAVKLTSRGPVLYRQVRLGKGARPFVMHKIRTMAHDCEKDSGARWSTAGDPRVTLVGRFLRKTHIDELPQLWNVLRGEMSLVGPRPERPEFVHKLEQVLPRYRDRLGIRPGLSGLAQVQLPPDSDLDSVRRKLAHDLFYIDRMSFWLDLRVLFTTALNLMGLPYSITRKLLLIPGGEFVEHGYAKDLAKAPDGNLAVPAGNGAEEKDETPAKPVPDFQAA